MANINDVNAALDDLSNKVDAYEARDNNAITALNAQIATLKTQLVNGPPGLTAEQGQVLLNSIATIAGKLAIPVGPDVGPVVGPVASVTLSPVTANAVLSGVGQQVTAVVNDGLGNVINGQSISWKSDNTAIATVDANGMVSGVAVGTCNITAVCTSTTAPYAVIASNAVAITVSRSDLTAFATGPDATGPYATGPFATGPFNATGPLTPVTP